jgi:hypothetical protein
MHLRNFTRLVLFALLPLLPLMASAELLYFNGARNDNAVKLEWKTGIGNKARLFEAERSTDGKKFQVIGNIKAAAEGGAMQYEYTDNKPLPGNLFYRLKMTGAAGEITYSYTVSIRYFAKSDWSVGPSPAKRGQYLAIEINNRKEQNQVFEIRVSNMDGEFLYRQTFAALPGRTRNILNFVFRNAGVQVIELRDGSGTIAVKRVVVY